MKFRYYRVITTIGLIALTPVVLIILPAEFFDNGESICLSKILLDRECYACGLTRGIMHLIHLDFKEAFNYNLLSFVVFPLLVVIWIEWILREIKKLKKIKKNFLPPAC
jgi:Protein of unknown function (DUF2752)